MKGRKLTSLCLASSLILSFYGTQAMQKHKAVLRQASRPSRFSHSYEESEIKELHEHELYQCNLGDGYQRLLLLQDQELTECYYNKKSAKQELEKKIDSSGSDQERYSLSYQLAALFGYFIGATK